MLKNLMNQKMMTLICISIMVNQYGLLVVPCSNGGPQVCEIGDWKISLRPRVKIAQSPHSALRASWGDWLIFTLGLREIFQSPISQT